MTTREKIRKLESKRIKVVQELLALRAMLPGTLGKTFRRCGKPTCWCADQRGHPYWRITWTQDAQSKTKAVSEQDRVWVTEMTRNHRTFQRLRRCLREFDARLAKLLDQRHKEVIDETRKRKSDP
jgi:hypothetical protein